MPYNKRNRWVSNLQELHVNRRSITENITFPVLSPARASNNLLNSLSILSISVRILLQDFRCTFTSRSPRTAFGFSGLGAQARSTREAKLHKDIIMHRVGSSQCPHAARLSQDMPGHARSLKENKHKIAT